MQLPRTFFQRLFATARKSRLDSNLRDELEAHLDALIEENLRRGMSASEARAAARREFGGVEQTRQLYREQRGFRFLDNLAQDVRYAFRGLANRPGFAAVAILTLALGIGANTAIFSLLNGLVLRNLDVPRPEQLVRFGVHAPDDAYPGLSLPMFEQLSRAQTVFSRTFCFWGDAVLNVDIDGSLSRADVWAVDGNFFTELGATPEVGRLLGPEDVQLRAANPEHIAVLGYGYWQRRFGGQPGVIGATLKVEGVPLTVIGVTRGNFSGTSADGLPEIIVPLNAEPLLFGNADVLKHINRPDALWIEAMGRLKPGVTVEQARAQLEFVWPPIQNATAPSGGTPLELASFRELRMKVESGANGSSILRTRFSKSLYIVLGVAGAVLLLACVNLAGLLLARAESRSHELSIRIALGGSRPRLVCQMLTESLVLSIAGTAVGFLLAGWGSRLLADFMISSMYVVPARLNISPDPRVLGFTAAAALLTGILVGLAPSWRASREDPQRALQQSTRSSSRGTGRLGRGLIVVQVALSMVLLAGAGLLLRSIEKLHSAQPGFRTRGVLAAGLYPKPGGYRDMDFVNYYRELLSRVSRIPGIESAGMVRMTPGNFVEWQEKLQTSGTNSDGFTNDFVMLMPHSFDALGMNLLEGRDFTWQDDDHASRVVIVSKNLAETLFPKCSAIGQHVKVTAESKWEDAEIVGVVNNASFYDLRKSPPLTVYVPSTQYGESMGYSDLIVQTKLPAAAVREPLDQVVNSLGHEYVFSIKTVSQLIDKTFLRERVTTMLSAFFGALGLLLAAIGLYAQVAYSVTRRTREIGIRVALGAAGASIQGMVLREALGLVLLGIAIGVPCALGACQMIATLLFGLSPHDPITLALVIAVLVGASLLAAYLPAHRALRIDPLVALRSE